MIHLSHELNYEKSFNGMLTFPKLNRPRKYYQIWSKWPHGVPKVRPQITSIEGSFILAAFDAAECGRQLHWHREIEKILSLRDAVFRGTLRLLWRVWMTFMVRFWNRPLFYSPGCCSNWPRHLRGTRLRTSGGWGTSAVGPDRKASRLDDVSRWIYHWTSW